MLFEPKCLGKLSLATRELENDLKKSYRIGPCAVGKKAVYLNSFILDRRFYIRFEDIHRMFKRVAMSKGGFSGKGVFGTMSYLVVEYGDHQNISCNFKYEDDVDRFLSAVSEAHPTLPMHSKEAEYKLKKAEEEEKKRYVDHLSETAEESIRQLKDAENYLNVNPALSIALSENAKQKRVIDNINPTYQLVAAVIMMLSVVACIGGVYAFFHHQGLAVYCVLFGIGMIFMVMSTRVLPTGKNNKNYAEKQWHAAVENMKQYLTDFDGNIHENTGENVNGNLDGTVHSMEDSTHVTFPVPACYAHPVVLTRMIRVIREGRAETMDEAFRLVKEDLKKLNASVTVTQKEYDEVVVVKPMFLVENYR